MHAHAAVSAVDILLLGVGSVLVLVVIGLIVRPPRVRSRADGRWRLPAADRDPGAADQDVAGRG
jgi:hypothetical protein